MLKVGLTGGIACGKSYTLRCFHSLGAYTIDADILARQVVEPGRPAYQQILDEFGKEILDSEGNIDRARLADIVFRDEQARLKLNAIVHPPILEEEARQMREIEGLGSRARSPMIVTDAALMIEVGSYRRYDFVVVVYCPPNVQLQRLLRRNDMDEEMALLRMRSQMPPLEKVKYADFVIETTGKMSETARQVQQVYRELLNRYEESFSA